MNKRLYVGNLNYSTTDKELEDLFSSKGNVVYSKIITRSDGKSRGFGFVEMETEEEAKKAMEEFNNTDFKDRTIIVNEAKERKNRNFSKDNSDRRYKKSKDDLDYKLKKLRKKFK